MFNSKIDQIVILNTDVVQLRINIDGKYDYVNLKKGSDLRAQPKEVQDICAIAWKDEATAVA